MSLEKRIKRRIIGRRHDLFAVTLPGFESLCSQELTNLSDTMGTGEVINGGVAFNGRLTDLYLAALHARTPVRLLLRLARFKATNFGQLERHVRDIPWELYLPAGDLPQCHVSTHHSRLYHSGAIGDRLMQGITTHWSELNIEPATSGSQALYVRLDSDMVTLSLDGCGAPLYQRGMKPHAAKAPIRETTAAGILALAGYRPDAPLLDPMCGSGTFSLEAALMAKAIPPGYYRSFAFMQWPAFRPQQWSHMKKTAGREIRQIQAAMIRASDADDKAVAGLAACIRKNALGDAIAVAKEDFFDLRPEERLSEKGLVVLNPPYGRRLRAEADIERQYREIALKLASDFNGWQAALVVPQKGLAKRLKLPLRPLPLMHGGLNLTLLVGTL